MIATLCIIFDTTYLPNLPILNSKNIIMNSMKTLPEKIDREVCRGVCRVVVGGL